MHRPIAPSLAVVGILALIASPAFAQQGTLLVANREGGSISYFDLALGVEIGRVPIGPRIPHEVASSPDGRWALTGEYGSADDPGHRLVVLDILNPAVVGYIDLGRPSRPHSMVFLPDGQRAVATMEDADAITLVDVIDRKVLRTYPTGGREGHMVRISPDGERAYVTNRGAEGTLSVIFLDEARGPVVIPTDEGAEGLAVTPDGQEVWVANRRAGTISIVDAASLRVVHTVDARPFPNRMEISAKCRVVVTNGMSNRNVASFLRIYDLRTRTVVDDVPLDEGRPADRTYGLLVRGERAFITDRSGGRILVFDLDDPSTPHVLAAEHERPDGMAWSPLRVAALGDASSRALER